MPRRCSVYALFSSGDGAIRYIGQTAGAVHKRVGKHLSEAVAGRARRHAWIRSVVRTGCSLEFFILRADANWCVDEIECIRQYRELGCDLVNGTDGGDGVVNLSDEARKKISAKAKGRKPTDEQRKAQSRRMLVAGISPEQRQKMVDGVRRALIERGDEISAKLSAARMGREVSPETRASIATALRGKKRSIEVKARFSLLQKVRFSDPAERAKTSEATRKAMQTPEVSAKMAAVAKDRWSKESERQAQSERVKAHFADPANRAKQSERRSKLTSEQIAEARALRSQGMKLKELCSRFGLSMGAMSMLCSGKRSQHL